MQCKYLLKGICELALVPVYTIIGFIEGLIYLGQNPYEEYSPEWYAREEELRTKGYRT